MPRRSVVAGAAVDALAEQVGVAVVARVLLDHVGDDPAQRPGLARALRRLLAENIQARGLRDRLPRRSALFVRRHGTPPPGRPGRRR